MAEVMDIPLYATDLKDAALLDFYTGALWWGREQGFSIEQLSAFFTVVHKLINNIKGAYAHFDPLYVVINSIERN